MAIEVPICVGGMHEQNWLDEVEVYCSAKNKWCKVAPMRAKRLFPGAAFWRGKLYVTGGGAPDETLLNSVECYDPETNSWSPFTSFREARDSCMLVNHRDTLFLIGGWDKISLNSVEMYDSMKHEWTPVASLSEARSRFAAVSTKDGILVAAGCQCDPPLCLSSCEIYDFDSDKWTDFAPLNIARSLPGAAVCRDNVYVLGGEDCDFNQFNNVEQYEYESKRWVLLQVGMIYERRLCAVAYTADRIFIAGGKDNQEGNHVEQTECFDPAENKFALVAALSKPRIWFAFTTLRLPAITATKLFDSILQSD